MILYSMFVHLFIHAQRKNGVVRVNPHLCPGFKSPPVHFNIAIIKRINRFLFNSIKLRILHYEVSSNSTG